MGWPENWQHANCPLPLAPTPTLTLVGIICGGVVPEAAGIAQRAVPQCLVVGHVLQAGARLHHRDKVPLALIMQHMSRELLHRHDEVLGVVDIGLFVNVALRVGHDLGAVLGLVGWVWEVAMRVCACVCVMVGGPGGLRCLVLGVDLELG